MPVIPGGWAFAAAATCAGVIAGWLFGRALRSLQSAPLRGIAYALSAAAAIYVGFAVVSGRPDALWRESAGLGLFAAVAWAGLRHSPRWLAAGWLAHAVWDAVPHLVETVPAVAPLWYAYVCLGFDAVIAALAWRLARRPSASSSPVADRT